MTRYRNQLLSLLFVLAFITSTCAAPPLPDLRDLDVHNWDCLDKEEGTARDGSGAERNRMKNRNWVEPPAKVPNISYDEFVRNATTYDADLGAATRSKLSADKKATLAKMEKQIVSVTGWIVLTYPGPPESCNCGSAEFHDWHIELLPKPLDHSPGIGDPTALICEVTPRTESALYRADIRLTKLAVYMRAGEPPNLVTTATGSRPHKVRITGYLMWDDAHNKAGKDIGPTIQSGGGGNYATPWRATAWEIHPILKIEDLGQ